MSTFEKSSKYTYNVGWSEEDGVFVSRCLEFPGLSAHGKTAKKALEEIMFVVEESIKWLEEDSKPIPEPLGTRKFKGNLTLRMSSEEHRQLAIKSAEEGVSINHYVLHKIF